MNKSFNMPNLKKFNNSINEMTHSANDDLDIIDVSKLNFDDDETWLYPTESQNYPFDYKSWLTQGLNNTTDELISMFDNFHITSDDSRSDKIIDSRTFTRPKKRFIRPSIEKYNEEIYGECDDEIINQDLLENNKNEIYSNGIPLNNINKNVSNSKPINIDFMQSSTTYFDNILANAVTVDSFQNMSPPSLVNSMCSSTFTNLMENSFIKNDPVLREIRDADYSESVLMLESEKFQSLTDTLNSLNSEVPENLLNKIVCDETFLLNNPIDTTYSKNVKLKNSFTLCDVQESKTTMLQENDYKENNHLNSTIKLNNGNNHSNNETLRYSFSGSSSSNDNFDCMSVSSSNSSCKESKKILNIDGINEIVAKQEKCLQGIYESTPKVNSVIKKQSNFTWENVSPVKGEIKSDPVLSSIDKCINNTQSNFNTYKKPTKYDTLKIGGSRQLGSCTDFRGSQPILNNLIKSSQTNLKTNINDKGSNLRTLGPQLKGSYTSLRPVNANLPIAPPPLQKNRELNATITLEKSKPNSDTKLVQNSNINNNNNNKISNKRATITGIPRPISRIPAPKNSLRSTYKTTNQQCEVKSKYDF